MIYFFKYHNGAILILAAFFLLGSAVFASEDIKSAIGTAQTAAEGFDNSVLLEADLENFNMEFKIEKVEKEKGYYFIHFSFLDLAKEKEGWQYKLKHKILKFKEKPGLAIEKAAGEELAEIRLARIKFLKSEQEKARISGLSGRTEITEYSGLIGKTFDIAAKIFPGFESASKKDLPLAASLAVFKEAPAEAFDLNLNPAGLEIDLTEVYANYLIETGSVDGAANGQTATSTENVAPESGSSGEGIEGQPTDPASGSSEPEVEIIDLSEAENQADAGEPVETPAAQESALPEAPASELPASQAPNQEDQISETETE